MSCQSGQSHLVPDGVVVGDELHRPRGGAQEEIGVLWMPRGCRRMRREHAAVARRWRGGGAVVTRR